MEDNILKKFETNDCRHKIYWSNYQHCYDWFWDKINNKPAIFPKDYKDLEITSAIFLRDWSVALKLKEIGVKKVLDIGSDTGHFMAVLKANNIESVGVDIDSKSCELINSKRVNLCYNVAIQDLINIKKLENKYDCLTCFNIFHVKWEDEKLKEKFILWIEKNFQYLVISDMKNELIKRKRLSLIYDFNSFFINFNYFVYKILTFLKLSNVIVYRNIHKLYKIKKDV